MSNSKASARRVARSIKAHSLVAVIFGGLIYLLAVTGTLSVFNHELQRWEQPGAPEMTTVSPEAAESAAAELLRRETSPTAHLYINFPQPDLPRTVITTDNQAYFATSDGRLADKEAFPWTQFLLDLHYYLHMPHVIGLTVVGALGAMLIALSFSGLLAHPRIFRDAFVFRRGAGQLTTADLHNRLSVWTLPFHFSNALTGAILGLATILAYAIAAAGFDNDIDRVFDPVFGTEPPALAAPAPLANIAAPLADMAKRYPDAAVTHFILHDPATLGQHSQVLAEHHDRLIFGDYYNYSASGQFMGNVGISDGTAGQQITGAVYNVHFGNWGGLPVKLAYLLFGTALCIIIASGLGLYFARREAKGDAAPRLAGAWAAMVWGTPAMLGATLVAAQAGATGPGLIAIFWTGLAGWLVAGGRLGKTATAQIGALLIPLLLTAALALHAARHGELTLAPAARTITAALLAASIGLALTAAISRRRKTGRRRDIAAGAAA